MSDWNLGSLLRLQQSDMRCRDLEKRLKLLPAEMNNLLAKRDKLAAATAAAAAALKKEELAAKNDESEIEHLNSESRKLQQQSALVKKNDEYQAMLSAIEQNKVKVGEMEEKLLLRFDRIEELRNEALRVKRENDAATRSLKQEFDEMVAFSKTVKEEIAKLQKERPSLCQGISDDKLRHYERLLAGKNENPPIVKVENGSCGCCHLKVTLQTMNQLKKGEFTTCDDCQHMLYLEEELHG